MPGADDVKDQPGADDKDQKDSKDGKGAGADDGKDQGEGGDSAGFKSLEEANSEIKKLRAENAKNRTKNKGLEDQMKSLNGKFDALKKAFGGEEDDVDPETKVKDLAGKNEALSLEVSIMSLVNEHEIPKAQQKYFRFLLAEKLESLKDDEEISDDDVAVIAAEVKKHGAAGGGSKSTSVGDGKGGGKDADAGDGKMTVEQFAKLSTVEKSIIYQKNPTEYNRLFSLAVEKRLL